MTKPHPNRGSTLEDFLEEDGVLQDVTVTAIKRVIAYQLSQSMAEGSITKTEMAQRMATSRAQLDRVLDPTNGNVTLDTLSKAARAVGRSIKLELA